MADDGESDAGKKTVKSVEDVEKRGEPVPKKHRGIPQALFLENVDGFMKKEGYETAESTLKNLDEQHQKYKFMELNLLGKKRRLLNQVPDLDASLQMVKLLKERSEGSESLHTRFFVSPQLYATAEVPYTDRVCLWLGANVMLEYSIDEADALLSKNLATATKNLKDIEDDLGFLREQYTTTEVNMARVYNWDVKRRQASQTQSS